MKKIILISTAILLSLTFLSCESTKTPASNKITAVDQNDDEISTIEAPSEDTYESEDADEIEYSEDSEESDQIESDVYEGKVSTSNKSKKKGLISWGNTDKYLLPEDTSIFTPNALMKYSQKAASITIDPKTGNAGFGTSYMLAYYIVLFNSKSTEKYQKALNFYLDDFENKKLERRSKKSTKKYGSEEVEIDWGTIKTSTPSSAIAKCYFGYEFYEGSPYFTISIPPALNNLFLAGSATADEKSLNLKFYLTKAQAKKLGECISPEYVTPIILEYNRVIMGGEEQDADEY